MKLNQASDQHLEPSASVNSPFQSKLRSLWKQCICFISTVLIPSNEPIVREISDRNGIKKWHVYDPVTDRAIVLNSSEEVLVWLDEQHSIKRNAN